MTDVYVDSADVVVEVKQPTVPPAAKPPNIGLVEVSQVVQRGSAWMTGNGPPALPGGQYGDMYLDATTGDMYQWNGNSWDYVGTFAPSTLTPEEILAALITVDGPGSALDADLLDGEHGAYYAKQSDMDTQTTRNNAQDTQLANHELRIGGNETSITDLYDRVDAADAGQTPNAILTKITTVDGPGSGLDADTLDGHDTAYFLAATDYNAADILTKLKTVDGSGSGLDADTLDGETGADFHDLTKATGTINDAKHGNLGGGTLHAPATAAAFGFFKDAASDDKQYVRKNGAWMEVSVPPGTFVGESPPPNPPDNQMWMRSSTGALYIYYFDGNSRQWMQVSASPQVSDTRLVWRTAQRRNRVVNPAMQISQELGAGNTNTTNNGYPADQWVAYWVTTGVPAQGHRQDNPSPDKDVDWFFRFSCTTADTSLAATEYYTAAQRIEGNEVADLKWGTPNAIPAVCRIKARSTIPGTFGIRISMSGSTPAYFVKMCTITTPNVWTWFEFPVPPPDVGSAMPIDNASSLAINVTAMSGSNYASAPVDGAWSLTSYLATAQQTNWMSATNQYLEFTNVGLYADPESTGIAPPWELPGYEEQLRKCKRYWEKGMVQMGGPWSIVSSFQITANFTVEKRAAPTIGGAYSYNNSSAGSNSAITQTEFISSASNSVGNAFGRFTNNWIASARM